MSNTKQLKESRFYNVLPTLQDLLEDVMENFEAYSPEFVRHAVNEANTIIDDYLELLSFKHARYAYFDFLEEATLSRFTGIAYLESFDNLEAEIKPKSQNFKKMHFGYSYQLEDGDALLILDDKSGSGITSFKYFNTYDNNLDNPLSHFSLIDTTEMDAAIVFSAYYFFSVFEIEQEKEENLYLN